MAALVAVDDGKELDYVGHVFGQWSTMCFDIGVYCDNNASILWSFASSFAITRY